MEDIRHANNVFKILKLKHLGEYHHLYVQIDKAKKDILKFTKDFITNYDEDSDKGYFLEVDVECPKNLHDMHNDLPFYTTQNEN